MPWFSKQSRNMPSPTPQTSPSLPIPKPPPVPQRQDLTRDQQPLVVAQILNNRGVSDVTRNAGGLPQLWVEGKQGQRPARLFDAVPLVDALVKDYPQAWTHGQRVDGVPLDQSWYLTSYNITFDDGLQADQCPRLSKRSPLLLERSGVIASADQVQATIAMIDGDLADLYPKSDPRYAAWYASPDPTVVEKLPWNAERFKIFQEETLPRLKEQAPWVDRCACWYTTENGWRMVFLFDRPVPLTGQDVALEPILLGMMASLALAGVGVDTGCKDWTRLMRVPRCWKGTRQIGRGEFFRCSWNGVDSTAQDLEDPPQTLQAYPPEIYPKFSDYRVAEYAHHPQWSLFSRIMTGAGTGKTWDVADMDVGTPPDEEGMATLLHLTGRKAPTLAAETIKKHIKKVAGHKKFQAHGASAQRLWKLVYDEAEVLEEFAAAHGKSGLHYGNYFAVWELCGLLRDESAATPQMIYALLLPSYLKAMEKRSQTGDAGVRSSEEIRREVWRAIEKNYPVQRAVTQQKSQEEQEERARAQEALDQLSKSQDDARNTLVVELAAMTGRTEEWARANLQTHLLISSKLGTSVLQLVNGQAMYSDPVTRMEDLLPALRRSGHMLIDYWTGDKEPKVKRLVDLMEAYGTSCGENVTASRLIDRHKLTFTQESGEYRPCFKFKLPGVAEDIEAVYHAEIEEYFRLVGGPYAEKLLDWLACMTKIESPLPALYLNGAPGIGKGMITEGMKLLSARKQAAAFSDALGSFQDFFKDTYIVLMDEDTGDAGIFRKDVVGVLRRMIGGQLQHLNFKGVKGMLVDGEWRLIITANNPDVLEIKKDLSSEDIQALNGRIFYLDSHPQSTQIRQFLLEHGGRYGNEYSVTGTETNKWPLKIAQYVMWLTQNRQVKHGERFLMDAPPTLWHENLRVTSAGGIIVCQALAAVIRQAEERNGCTDIVVIDQVEEQVYIRLDAFERFVDKQYPKFKGQLVGPVTRLSTGKTRIRWPEPGRRVRDRAYFRVHILDLSAIIQTLHQNGYDADFRGAFGASMWDHVVPEHLWQEFQDGLAPSQPPPSPPSPPVEGQWLQRRKEAS